LQEWLCERLFPVRLAHVVVLVLAARCAWAPPAVVLASGAAGMAGAVELARAGISSSLPLARAAEDGARQRGTGQLARLTGRVTLPRAATSTRRSIWG